MTDDNQILVSIIVPVFNAQKSLPPLFRSLSGQTYPHQLTEILFVDNGSTDGTSQLIKKFTHATDITVRIVEEFDCPGSYAARNKGIEHANGQILAFTDADCIPEKDWIAHAVARLSVEGSEQCSAGELILSRKMIGSQRLWKCLSWFLAFLRKRISSEMGTRLLQICMRGSQLLKLLVLSIRASNPRVIMNGVSVPGIMDAGFFMLLM